MLNCESVFIEFTEIEAFLEYESMKSAIFASIIQWLKETNFILESVVRKRLSSLLLKNGLDCI
jgi:hypothetical protein